jgi:hypothetical protein
MDFHPVRVFHEAAVEGVFQPVLVFPEAAVAGVFHPQLLHSCVAGNNFLFFQRQFKSGQGGSTSRNI